MEIIWKEIEGKGTLGHEQKINLEYAVRLEVVKILIKEAEHLLDYLSLVFLDLDSSNGTVSVNSETPEPLFSKISRNLSQFQVKENQNFPSSHLAAVNI